MTCGGQTTSLAGGELDSKQHFSCSLSLFHIVCTCFPSHCQEFGDTFIRYPTFQLNHVTWPYGRVYGFYGTAPVTTTRTNTSTVKLTLWQGFVTSPFAGNFFLFSAALVIAFVGEHSACCSLLLRELFLRALLGGAQAATVSVRSRLPPPRCLSFTLQSICQR